MPWNVISHARVFIVAVAALHNSLQEVHFDNPNLDSGVIENSGVRFYYSTKLRQLEMGVMASGDPSTNLRGTPLSPGLSEHTFVCPSSCSAMALSGNNDGEQQPIHVFHEKAHMHRRGVAVTNEILRYGQVFHSSRLDFFDFDQQGVPNFRTPSFDVYPGDSIRTRCVYRSPTPTTTTSTSRTRYSLMTEPTQKTWFALVKDRVTKCASATSCIIPAEKSWENCRGYVDMIFPFLDATPRGTQKS